MFYGQFKCCTIQNAHKSPDDPSLPAFGATAKLTIKNGIKKLLNSFMYNI